MQRFYGLNIDFLGVEYSVEHAAACLSCMPMTGALFASEHPEYATRIADVPIKAIADALRKEDNNELNNELDMEPVTMEEFESWLNGTFIDEEGGRTWR